MVGCAQVVQTSNKKFGFVFKSLVLVSQEPMNKKGSKRIKKFGTARKLGTGKGAKNGKERLRCVHDDPVQR
jgi:hypothetical protein